MSVDVKYIEIPDALFSSIQNGGYENDEATKAQMFDWVERIWLLKDQRIASMLAEFETEPAAIDA